MSQGQGKRGPSIQKQLPRRTLSLSLSCNRAEQDRFYWFLDTISQREGDDGEGDGVTTKRNLELLDELARQLK